VEDPPLTYFRTHGVFPLWQDNNGVLFKLHGTISAICTYIFNGYLHGTLTATSAEKVEEVLEKVSFMPEMKCVSSLTSEQMCEFLRAHLGNMYQVIKMLHANDRRRHRRVPGATRDLSSNWWGKELEVLIEHNQNCASMLNELGRLNTIKLVFERLKEVPFLEECARLPPIVDLVEVA
jgi:hypothetical protein